MGMSLFVCCHLTVDNPVLGVIGHPFFLIKKKGAAWGESALTMHPDSKFSLMNDQSSSYSEKDKGYTFPLDTLVSSFKSILWSYGLCSGSASKDSLVNTFLKVWNSLGTVSC
jgi:hypothetical protein